MRITKHTTTARVLWVALIGLTGCGQANGIQAEGIARVAPTTSTPTSPATVSTTTQSAPTVASTSPPTIGIKVSSTPAPAPIVTEASTTSTTAPSPVTTSPDDNNDDAATDPEPEEQSANLTEEQVRQAVDPTGEASETVVVAWGDIDDDGDNDALVVTTYCGASCGTELTLVLDQDGSAVADYGNAAGSFSPWYNGSGAGQSSLMSAAIETGRITLVGTGLCPEGLEIVEVDQEGACNFLTVRTATYIYRDGIVEPVALEPPVT